MTIENGIWTLQRFDTDPALTPGDYVVEATATDAASNSGSSAGLLRIEAFIPERPWFITLSGIVSRQVAAVAVGDQRVFPDEAGRYEIRVQVPEQTTTIDLILIGKNNDTQTRTITIGHAPGGTN